MELLLSVVGAVKQNHKLKDYKFTDDFLKKVNEQLSEIIVKQGYKLKN